MSNYVMKLVALPSALRSLCLLILWRLSERQVPPKESTTVSEVFLPFLVSRNAVREHRELWRVALLPLYLIHLPVFALHHAPQ